MKKNKLFDIYFLSLTILLFFLLTTSCNRKPKLIKISGNTMGTTYKILIVSKDKKINKIKLKKNIDDLLNKVNMEMSTYIKDSEISRFNSSSTTEWFPVSEGFAKVVKNSIDISKKSNGSFDVTISPLIDLWGFGKRSGERIPNKTEIDQISQYTGYKNLDVKFSPPYIKKKTPKLQINLSAIAKGYGVDKVVEFLNSRNYKNYLVEIGGEVRVGGKKFNKKWRIGVLKPDTIDKYNIIVLLSDISLATSGDYFNYFEKDGRRYSHTIDPVTKRPITHKLASVTVVHKSCMLADGLATAINVMGPDKGYEFALKEGLPIYMIIRKDKGFVIKMTPSFKKLLSES